MLEVRNVSKRYPTGKVLSRVNLTFQDTGLYGIMGTSGSGKTTLLHILGGIDQNYTGNVYYNHQNIRNTNYRKKHVSFIFQFLHLIPWLNVLNNISISHFFRKSFLNESISIDSFKDTNTSLLSLGQKQRISYNRAVNSVYDVLLCDEPTGSLDEENSVILMQHLKKLSKNNCVIIASHNHKLMNEYCDVIIEIEDGKVMDVHTFNEIDHQKVNQNPTKRKLFPHIYLTYQYMLENKKRCKRICLGLIVSLLCLLVTFSFSSTIQFAIDDYIDALLPTSSISIKSTSAIDEDTLTNINNENIIKRQLFIEDYDFMGISFKKKYSESSTLFINDDNAPNDHLTYKIGNAPTSDHEVALSYSTAKEFVSEKNIDDLIGKKIYAWYHHDNKMISITYKVVGITENSTALTTLYTLDNAYIHLLEDKGIETTSYLGILYMDKQADINNVLNELKSQYNALEFQITGEATHSKVNTNISNLTKILSAFSVLLLVSAVCLIGEILYLNNLTKKHDYAIMSCFGGRIVDFVLIQFIEMIICLLISSIVVLIVYNGLITVINIVIKQILFSNMLKIHFDLILYFKVLLIGLSIMMISEIIPLVQVYNLNVSKELR